MVFLELLRRGYRIRVGSSRDREVDFTAEKDGRVEYYLVTMSSWRRTHTSARYHRSA